MAKITYVIKIDNSRKKDSGQSQGFCGFEKKKEQKSYHHGQQHQQQQQQHQQQHQQQNVEYFLSLFLSSSFTPSSLFVCRCE